MGLKRAMWFGVGAVSLLLVSCGGGSAETTSGTMTDSNIKVISALTLTSVVPTTIGDNNGIRVQLTAQTPDPGGVTGYCIKNSNTPPQANDPCFSSTNTKTLGSPQTVAYYAWAKDASGKVTSTAAPVGCSAAAVDAANADQSGLPLVCMSTSMGQMVFLLDIRADAVPNVNTTTDNFLRYVNAGFYSQTVFHRVAASPSIIQAGAFTKVPISDETAKKAGTVYDPIKLEPPSARGLSNTKGTLAMARTTVPDSATNQFYINVTDNTTLDTNGGGYAVFGKVIFGMDTVERIKAVPVTGEQPINPPVIYWAYQMR